MTTLDWKPVGKRTTVPSPAQSQAGSPTFQLNLKTALAEPIGLYFPDPPKTSPVSNRVAKRNGLLDGNINLPRPMPTLKFIAVTQGMVILILTLLVFGLLYWSWRLNSNMRYYYFEAAPYIQQAMDHGVSIFRHTDSSSASLENVMAGAEEMATVSMPALMNAVNRSVNMVTRMEHLTYNPTIRMSLG